MRPTSIGVDDATAHPRPTLRRPASLLDGSWDYAADHVTMPGSTEFDRVITVPFAPETPASGIGTSSDRAWYRRSVAVHRPADGRRLLLQFGAVDRRAQVFVDGNCVAFHEGGYTPFTVDITDHVRDEAIELVVGAEDDHTDLAAPRGKQEWLAEPHGIWYPRTTGIWRSVYLEETGSTRIDDLDWQGSAQAMTVTLRARVAGPRDGLRLRARITAAGRLVAELSTALASPEVAMTTAIGDGGFDDRSALVWSPRRPVLLDADVALVDGRGGVVDEVRSYTALRDVTVDDGHFCLNGRSTWLRLALDQGYWPDTGLTPPDSDALRADVELALALGFNGVRKHQKVEDPRFYAWADRLGLLAWVEMPSAYRSGTVAAGRLLDEWRHVVEAHRNHPSVVSWVPVNESWGVPDVAGDPRQRGLVEALAAMTDTFDGTRPVSANDGWETVGGDIVGIHDYTQDAASLATRYATREGVEHLVASGRPMGRVIDLDGSGTDGRAVILSEFGGVALAGEGTWGYQVVGSAEELLERYRDLWAAAHSSAALAGACWTQLTDTYQEANGVVDMARQPKMPVDAVRKATRGR